MGVIILLHTLAPKDPQQDIEATDTMSDQWTSLPTVKVKLDVQFVIPLTRFTRVSNFGDIGKSRRNTLDRKSVV